MASAASVEIIATAFQHEFYAEILEVLYDKLNRRSRFVANRNVSGSQRFQIARFESQRQNPLKSL